MERIKRCRIAHVPTPMDELPRLSAFLGGPRSLLKRDDQTGLALGGNKTRKLEFLIAEALDQGAAALNSAGAILLFARYEGILLDPVYTGGRPALFAAKYEQDIL